MPPLIEIEQRARAARLRCYPPAARPEPAHCIMLDLAAAELRGERMKTSALGVAAGIPAATMLRHLQALLAAGLCERWASRSNARIAWVKLTEQGRACVRAYCREIGGAGAGAGLELVEV